MSSWKALESELDRWQEAGLSATFWWRDDDAEAPSPALDRLLALRASRDLPLALAVVPAGAGAALAERLAHEKGVRVLQHGYAHRNHAAETEKTIELGPHRPLTKVMAELRAGRRRLEALFGRRFHDIVVPPWNRIDRRVVGALAPAGYHGLSVSGPRAQRFAGPGLVQVNVHMDVMDWSSRRFLGTAPTLKRAVHHLRLRREGEADVTEPTGLMTHHLAHDRAAWDFIARFLDETEGHSAGRWIGTALAFRQPRGSDRTP
jgi:peptidoglycan/xylan/chitin deacetylase (PgdA/CDA1 family)